MKNLLYPISIVAAVAGFSSLTSCDVIDQIGIPITFSQTTSLTIPVANLAANSTTQVGEFALNIDLNEEVKEQNSNLSINNINSVKLSELTMTYVRSNNGTRLDVIKNARIYIKSPNTQRTLIASADNNTKADEITFVISNAELLEHLRTPENSLLVEIDGQKTALDQMEVRLNSKFRVLFGL